MAGMLDGMLTSLDGMPPPVWPTEGSRGFSIKPRYTAPRRDVPTFDLLSGAEMPPPADKFVDRWPINPQSAGMLASVPMRTPAANWPDPNAVPPLPPARSVAERPVGGIPAEAALPPNAQPTSAPGAAAPTAPQATPVPDALPPAAPAVGGDGFLGKLSNVLARNPNMLMAMGAGFAGAPSIGQAMSRGFAAAGPAAQQDIKTNLQMSGMQESYKALVQAGATPQEALAAVMDPSVMKAVTPRVFGTPMVWKQLGTDAYGNPRFGFVNESQGTVVPSEGVTKPRVNSIEDALRLPKGTHFMVRDNNGQWIEKVR